MEVRIDRRPSVLWLFLAFLLAVAGIGFAVGMGRAADLSARWADWVNPEVRMEADRAAVVLQMQQLAVLETAVLPIEQRVTGQRGSDSSWSFVGEKILFVARGDVVAGIDLSKLRQEDVWGEKGQIHIRLPRAEVLRVDLDEEASFVESRERGWFGIPDPDFETKARRRAVQLLEQTAREQSILQEADQSAERAVRGLLEKTSTRTVVFEH